MGDIDVWNWRVLAAIANVYVAVYVIWAAMDRITGKTFNKGYEAGVRSRNTPGALKEAE